MQVQRLFLALGCQCQGVVDLRDLAARCGTLTAAERSCSLATLVSAAAVPPALARGLSGQEVTPYMRGMQAECAAGTSIQKDVELTCSNWEAPVLSDKQATTPRARCPRSHVAVSVDAYCLIREHAAPDTELFRCRSFHGEPAAFGALSAPLPPYDTPSRVGSLSTRRPTRRSPCASTTSCFASTRLIRACAGPRAVPTCSVAAQRVANGSQRAPAARQPS